MQVCKKLLPRVLASRPALREKIEATFHLTANLAYPLMVLLAGLMFPAMVLRYNMGWAEMIVVDVPIFLAATVSVCTFYALSQKEQFKDGWKRKLRYIPAVLGIGIGISINNALAVIEGLLGKPSEFARTPKYGIEGASDTWKQKAYKGKSNWVPYVELLLACYFTFSLDLRDRQRPRGDAAVHRDLPVGLPVHLGDVPGAELRLARAAPAGGLRALVIDTSVQSRGVRRVLLVTLGLNVAVAALKVVVGHLSLSLAMVADGYHSLVDSSNNVIGLVVAAFAFRPPDRGPPLRPPQVRDRGDGGDRPRAALARLEPHRGRPRPDTSAGAARDLARQLGGDGRDDRREPLRERLRGARRPAPAERVPGRRRRAHAGRPLRLAGRRGVVRGGARGPRLGRPAGRRADRGDHRLAGAADPALGLRRADGPRGAAGGAARARSRPRSPACARCAACARAAAATRSTWTSSRASTAACTLHAAHDVADRIEAALQQSHPEIADVVVHLEPDGPEGPSR